MPTAGRGLHLGVIAPHLRRTDGVRRMLEFGNRLTARGHDVTFYLPDGEILNCAWMRCDASIKTWRSGFDDALDVALFTEEPHWHLLDRFVSARRRIFYALRSGRAHGQAGSWEAVRAPVDLQLASSNWTADQILAETGSRPTVQWGGVDREVFRPFGGPKRYPLLCTGGEGPDWKGTRHVHEAGRLLGLAVEDLAPKGLALPDVGREYDAAELFLVGSWSEGFGAPGLEALACGVPLITTDNGGCRDYAIDGETALVVAPRDPVAMANAVRHLGDDDRLAKQLVGNGLELVARDFDWERRTDELAEVLDGVSAGSTSAPPPPRPAPPKEPVLSVVVLAWDNLGYTQDFVESVRRHTDVPYELIIVDNGSQWQAADYARAAADVAVLNEANLGFSPGMNQGLAAARGRYVAFCNNDTVPPPGWASRLVEAAETHPAAGIVVPAITGGVNNELTIRNEPGDEVRVLPPFSAPPPAVIFLMATAVAEAVGGWGEEYVVASGEDVDLGFKVWVNGLDIVFDERVLVDHVGKVSSSKLPDWQTRWAENRAIFLAKWAGNGDVPRLASCDEATFARNRATAAAVAEWMGKYFTARDKARAKTESATADQSQRERIEARLAQWQAIGRKAQKRAAKEAGRNVRRLRRRLPPKVTRWIRTVLASLPPSVEEWLRQAVRR